MISLQMPPSFHLGTGSTGRWKLWALFAFFAFVASFGTWITGQYQIGRLDSLKNKYDEPVNNYAKYYGDSPSNSLERDLLEGCKQAQIGSWLQTTDALRFDNPITGNRVGVRLDAAKAYVDLNGNELSDCIHDEVEDRQFDIGSMTNTWAIILLLLSFCLGAWSWVCRQGFIKQNKSRNIYAETLAETAETQETEEKIEPVIEPVVEQETQSEPK
jgi:hypothetical protein